ncbi:MAG TPA: hypothetical protein VIB99_07385 [Candidatus Limnocylindrales bacterium]
MTQLLPRTRAELLALHAQARKHRDSAPLGGPDYRAACEEIAAIEVQIARIEVAQAASPGGSPAGSPVSGA